MEDVLAIFDEFEATPASKNHQFIDESVTLKLGCIFRKHYGEHATLMLIGRTDGSACKVRDLYVGDVATLLGPLGPWYESRAIARLNRPSGGGSLPFLCVSSVCGIWQVCQSTFYTRQLSLVSFFFSSALPATPAESRQSFTGGSSRLQDRRSCGALGATTPLLSTCSCAQGQGSGTSFSQRYGSSLCLA